MSNAHFERLKETVEAEVTHALTANPEKDRHAIFETCLKTVLNDEHRMSFVRGDN